MIFRSIPQWYKGNRIRIRYAAQSESASRVSATNIIRWVLWRDESMPFTYVDKQYVVPDEWIPFFSWMLSRIEQHA